MSADGMTKQNKVKLSVTVSKKTADRASDLSKSDEYGGLSNVVETALSYYFGSIDKEKEINLADIQNQLSSMQKELSGQVSAILALISRHPELLSEYNELRKTSPSDNENIRKVKFE